MNRLILLLLSSCSGALLGAEDDPPLLDLGALADDYPLGGTATDPTTACAAQLVEVKASGPVAVDPTDPYSAMVITITADINGDAEPGTDAVYCGHTCLHTTDCWVVRAEDGCDGKPLSTPASFGAVVGTPATLLLCVQATGASRLPLFDTVEIRTNDPASPRTFAVTGPRP
jgi:hypothetical protein